MEIVSLFNGEERRAREVTTRQEILVATNELAIGDGWGQCLRGSVEELRSVGAHPTHGSGWVLWLAGETCLDCEVV